jgi:hypothetical protein
LAVFYRGAGIGTYWHQHDARVSGFTPHAAGAAPGLARMVGHIRSGTTYSPYVSLTRSYDVALDYALVGRAAPTSTAPAFVYEITIDDPPPSSVSLLNPLHAIVQALPGPLASPTYQHDGSQTFLHGVLRPAAMSHHLTAHLRGPPPGHAVPRPATLTNELETIVRALRDAEILAQAVIPASCVTQRFDVW